MDGQGSEKTGDIGYDNPKKWDTDQSNEVVIQLYFICRKLVFRFRHKFFRFGYQRWFYKVKIDNFSLQ